MDQNLKDNLKSIIKNISNTDKENLGILFPGFKLDNFLESNLKYSIIKEDNKSIGFYGGDISNDGFDLIYLYILPEYRKKGYSKRTLTELINLYKNVNVFVFCSNKPMISLLLGMNGDIIKDADEQFDGEITIRLKTV